MSIQYEKYNKEYNGSSRYQTLKVIVDDEGHKYLETFNQVKIPESDDDQYHVVNHTETSRLDIISNIYYGDLKYWWVIALANNIIDPFAVVPGMMLRIPSLLTISNSHNGILTRPGGF